MAMPIASRISIAATRNTKLPAMLSLGFQTIHHGSNQSFHNSVLNVRGEVPRESRSDMGWHAIERTWAIGNLQVVLHSLLQCELLVRRHWYNLHRQYDALSWSVSGLAP